jgi:hypothetical protein
VQIKARKELQPLIDVVLARCSYVFKRLCDIGISVMKGGESGVLNVYEPFIKELRAVYGGFIDSVEELCRSKLMDDFETFTKILDWDLLTGLSDLGKEYARSPLPSFFSSSSLFGCSRFVAMMVCDGMIEDTTISPGMLHRLMNESRR